VYEKRYKGLNEREILNRFLCAILTQAIKDIKGNVAFDKIDSMMFSKTEYCELICHVAKVDYALYVKCVNIERI
jgi:AAA+ superfamily predicted ATPase